MEFFQKVHQLGLQGDLRVVCQTVGEKLIVSVLLTNEQCGDKAQQLIKPLLFNGLPEAIDEAFFRKITEPYQQTSQLLVSMEDHLKSVALASEQSAMAKAAETKQRKEAEEQKKTYDGLMVKVTELEEAGKYREACAKLPDPTLFPNQQEAITKKREELVQKFSAPTLFESINA